MVGHSFCEEDIAMCYFSKEHEVRGTAAQSGETLQLKETEFGGPAFYAVDDMNTPVCVTPDTRLHFMGIPEQAQAQYGLPSAETGTFVESDTPYADHVDFGEGRCVYIGDLVECVATVGELLVADEREEAQPKRRARRHDASMAEATA